MNAQRLHIPAPIDALAPIAVTQSRACAITGRTRRTVQRWIAAGVISDPQALKHLQKAVYGLLPEPWDGWRVCAHTGALVSPEGRSWDRQALDAAWLNASLVKALRQRLEAQEKDLQRALDLAHQARPLGRLARSVRRLADRLDSAGRDRLDVKSGS